MTTEPVKSVRVIVRGRVQGVWFRSWTVEQARSKALAGWVRNKRNGTVEALFSGNPSTVDEMIEACHQGPPYALVEGVEIHPAQPPSDPVFNQKPSC